MRGASALQKVLHEYKDKPLRVFVVWEPVIATDVAPPTTGVLSRLSDSRASQYWDKDLLLSKELVRSVLSDPARVPGGMNLSEETIIWDVVALYPSGSRWDSTFPIPAYYGNPVVEAIDELRRHLSSQ